MNKLILLATSAAALVASSCAATGPDMTEPAQPAQTLLGKWAIDSQPDSTITFRNGEAHLRTPECGTASGGYLSHDGRLVVDLNMLTNPDGQDQGVAEETEEGCWQRAVENSWLTHVTGFSFPSQGRLNLVGPDKSVSLTRQGEAPTKHPKPIGNSQTPPLPGGVQPVTTKAATGKWVLSDGAKRPDKPYLHLTADGHYAASDGCNETSGRWLVGEAGQLALTNGPSTEVGCDNFSVSEHLSSAAVVAVDEQTGDLVAIDEGGQVIGTFPRT